MTLLKKINTNWHPEEKRDLLMGEIIDFPYVWEQLVREGNAVRVDEAGNEIYDAFADISCPLCKSGIKFTADNFPQHVFDEHWQKIVVKPLPVAPSAPIEKPIEAVAEIVDDKKKAFAEKMIKARAAAKAKREALKNG